MAGLASIEPVGDRVEDPSDGLEVVVVDQVDEELAHAGHVGRRGLRQRHAALLGEHRLDAAAVGDAGVPGDEPGGLHPADRVGDPGAGVAHRVGEHRHPEPVAGGLGEPDQDLVLRQRDPVLLAQVAVEPVHEQRRADQEGAPGALLLLVEPGDVGGVHRHGNKITGSVVED